jgi:hypothetical protein
MEIRTEASPWLIKEVMPDGDVYWMLRVTFGPIVDGPRYYGPFTRQESAKAFYDIIENELLDFTVELLNRAARFEENLTVVPDREA